MACLCSHREEAAADAGDERGQRRDTSIFIWITLRPIVRDAFSLQRTALSARPVVERRRLTMRMAMIANTASAEVGERLVGVREVRSGDRDAGAGLVEVLAG